MFADEADFREKAEGLRKELALWEEVLSKSPFVAGDTFTLADVAAGNPMLPVVDRSRSMPSPLQKLRGYSGCYASGACSHGRHVADTVTSEINQHMHHAHKAEET